MKVRIDIDCTPEEARAFLGLPDVRPIQDAVMEKMKDEMMRHLAAMDPETMFKTWFPSGVKGLEELQQRFWTEFSKGVGGGKT